MTGPLRLRALGPPRAQCSGCGTSCATYRVGPLTEDDLSRLRAAIPAVEAAYPDQDFSDPLSEEPYGKESVGHFLKKRDGSCVFRRADVGCTIHSVAGSEAKPLVCSLFPLQLLRTEDGIRIGVRPTCLNDIASWEAGPPVEGDLVEKLLMRPFGTVDREMPLGEDVLMRVLALPDLDTATVLSFLAQRPTRDDPPQIGGWLEGRLAALFEAADAVLGGDLPPSARGPLNPGTVTAAQLSELRAFRETEGRSEEWPELPVAFRPYVRDALRRLVFLRQTSLFPTLPWALIGYISAARWAAGWAVGTAADGLTDEDTLRFGRMFSTLLIVLESPRMQRALLEGEPPFE